MAEQMLAPAQGHGLQFLYPTNKYTLESPLMTIWSQDSNSTYKSHLAGSFLFYNIIT